MFENILTDYKLHFNSENVFNAEIILCVAMKNASQSIRHCLQSALEQKKVNKTAVFLLDDSSEDKWINNISDLLKHPKLVFSQCNEGKVALVRNLQLQLAKKIFSYCQWIGRLDADDQLEHKYSIFETLEPVLNQKTYYKWVLAGNTLKQDGKLLNRKNYPSNTLLTKEGLLKTTYEMSKGIPEAELPSCNLWIHKEMNVTYPPVPSGEDHWLVAFLLSHHSDTGLLRTETTYASYNLGGKATINARQSSRFLYSRQLLHDSVSYWLKIPNSNTNEIVLGWGKEAIVYRRLSFNRKTNRMVERKP